MPDGDGSAVAPGVTLHEFDGVAQGVAVVEDLAQAGFLQVLGDDAGFDGDGALDELTQDVGAGIRDGLRILLHEVKDGGIGDEAALDDLRHAGDDLVLGQGVQRVQVGEHGGGRVEGAHEVLAFGRVDPGLAAHGRVDHAEEAGGHVDDLDAAQPGGGHETGEVGDGAAADGDHGIGAGEIVLSQHLPAEGGHLDVLAFLGVRDFRRERR